jgi:hypothetical protein
MLTDEYCEAFGVDKDVISSQRVLTYIDGFYIEDNERDGFLHESGYKGRYFLALINDSWVDNKLEPLEKKLYEFAMEESGKPVFWNSVVYVLMAHNPADFSEQDITTVGKTKEAAEYMLRKVLTNSWSVMPNDGKQFYNCEFDAYVEVWKIDVQSHIVMEKEND